MHKLGLPIHPAFVWPQQTLKELHADNQEIAACHIRTEREITSSSLVTRMLKAALSKMGPG